MYSIKVNKEDGRGGALSPPTTDDSENSGGWAIITPALQNEPSTLVGLVEEGWILRLNGHYTPKPRFLTKSATHIKRYCG